ncbi:MAG: ABC transporter ATP-binding protein [Ilumatobacter sp.]|nr:ABC transporter ATP-binding protein [Ilumatobacter sp.]
MSTIVELRGVTKDYPGARDVVHALRSVDLSVGAGKLVAVHGRSGSGKTTLLNVIGGLDRADAGEAEVCGLDLFAASDRELAELRRTRVSFVFQAFGLLPVLSAAENVEVPLRLQGIARDARAARVRELLDLVGLAPRAAHRPSELSGGEQQRVAIARSLAASPSLLIADEPTGQLDSRTGAEIMALIHQVVAERSVAAIVATHDLSIIDVADHQLELSDGAVVNGQRPRSYAESHPGGSEADGAGWSRPEPS